MSVEPTRGMYGDVITDAGIPTHAKCDSILPPALTVPQYIPSNLWKQTEKGLEYYQNTEIIQRLGGIRLMLRLLFWVPLAASVISLIVYLGR